MPVVEQDAPEIGDYEGFAEIFKSEEQPDGTLMVYGKVTGPDMDLDGQRCDPAWLKTAMPEWFGWGNIREQHSNIAAGVGIELDERDGSWFLKSHIVDPGTVAKVQKKVLKGYSISVKNGKLLKTITTPNGIICAGDVAEVSLVDRPCLPSSTISIVKSASGNLMADAAELAEEAPDYAPPEVLFGQPVEYVEPTIDEELGLEADFEDDAEVAKGLDGGELETVGDIRKGFVMDLLTGKNDKPAGGGKKRDDAGRFARAAAKREREGRKAAKEKTRLAAAKDDAESAESLADAAHARSQGRGGEAAEHVTHAAGLARSGKQRRRVRDERGQTAAVALREKAMTADEITEWVTDLEGVLSIDEEALSPGEYRKALASLTGALSGDINKAAGTSALPDLLALLAHEAGELAALDEVRPENVTVVAAVARALLKMAGAADDDELDVPGEILKTASGAGATLVDAGEIHKAVTEATAPLQAEINSLRERWAQVEKSPIPGGPFVMTTAAPVNKAASGTPNATEAARLRTEAARVTDTAVRDAYIKRAELLEVGASS